jgi:AAA15 family ATPase/GTPase
LLRILLSISRSPSGICLIDEIENGFYYETLESVWSLVFKFASEFDTQVFVTTHSNECLHALVEIMKGKEDEFSLIRTIVSDGSHLVEQFDGTSLLAALKQRGEVR